MPVPADTLRSIKNFPDLVRYLEDKLDWPLQEYGFDELTFEYSPAELGLKDEDAAKVKAIHQLRPVVHGQPFGIFFVEFERKRMPVVVLRRILSHLVLKQRAGANRAGSAAWNMDDLLFISAFGDETSDQREIAFAHFHQEAGDLPTLRVLGWDGADTGLKLDYVAQVLRQRLCWPADPADVDAWRGQWSAAFRHRLGHVIRTADALAERLAALARRIRYAAITLMNHESDRGSLRQLHKAFQTALIHDLTEVDFADTYAQTVTYGLLTAAISRTDMTAGRDGTVLLAGDITEMVPITNPFLREMLQTFLRAGGQQGGINFDELGIQDVVELLRGDETDLPAILRDFGNKTRGEDPVIHFNEHFLSAYDKQLKIQRGIFYTPQPVVSYIVRSVHELLQTEFGLEDGLASIVTWGEMAQRFPGLKIPEGADPASPFVVILDPATGTGTFLVEVIEVIFRTLTAKWRAQRLTEAQQRDAWNDYVPRHLLPRLHGYELMMAPYAIAHMKIGLKLFETGYRFGSVERVRVYLTNALEPASDERQQLTFAGWAPALAREAQAVNAIKRWQRFTVVIGNPPYSKIGRNMGNWARDLVKLNAVDGVGIQSYYEVDGAPLEERKVWLQDDYVKFLRLAQYYVERSQTGILGYITNRGFLGNPTFNGMRQSLTRSFCRIHVLDLHGDTNVGEEAPGGERDQNVFDIQQGVAISIGTSPPHRANTPEISYAELWGSRDNKYAWLLEPAMSALQAKRILPSSPLYLYVPISQEGTDEFDAYWPLPGIMRYSSSGIVTSKDAFVIGFSDDDIRQRVMFFLDPKNSDQVVSEQLGLSENYAWRVSDARLALRKDSNWEGRFTDLLYRPFDNRRILLHGAIVWRPRETLVQQMTINTNIGLLATRQASKAYSHALCTRHAIEMKACSYDRNTELFPLWVFPLGEQGTLFQREPQANLADDFVIALQSSTGALYRTSPRGQEQFGPIDVFGYMYSILHSPQYRCRYASQLLRNYPRIPARPARQLFRSLSLLGVELVALHLMESPALAQHITTWAGPAAPTVEKVSYADGAVWINKAQTAGFRGVPEAVWAFHIGGYQVCDKWLKDRKGRALSAEDIEHYQRVVVALNETIRIMGEIDAAIEAHGGWPIQ